MKKTICFDTVLQLEAAWLIGLTSWAKFISTFILTIENNNFKIYDSKNKDQNLKLNK